jgi:protein involved in temperature-dependent protein secretion
MNFSVMSEFWIYMLIVLGLALSGLVFAISMQLYDTKGELKSAEKEIERAEELLNQKDKEFEIYRKKVAADKILITQGFVKSLFVLEHEPKFPKGYDCEDFVVLNVQEDFLLKTKDKKLIKKFSTVFAHLL